MIEVLTDSSIKLKITTSTADNKYTEMTIKCSSMHICANKLVLLTTYFNKKTSSNTDGDIYYYRNSLDVLNDSLLGDIIYDRKDPRVIFYLSILNSMRNEEYRGTTICAKEKRIYINNDDYTHAYDININYFFENSHIIFKLFIDDLSILYDFYTSIANYGHKYYLTYSTSCAGTFNVELNNQIMRFPYLIKLYDSYALLTSYFTTTERKYLYKDPDTGKLTEATSIIAYPSESYKMSVSNYLEPYDDMTPYDETIKDYYFYILDKLYEKKYITKEELLNVKMYLNVIE